MALIIFDCDGTLVDSQGHITHAMERAFAAHDIEAPQLAEVRELVGLSLEKVVSRLLPDASDETVASIADSYRTAFFEIARSNEPEPLYPGCVEALDSLAESGHLLAVATGKSRRGLLSVLEAHSIRDRFASLKTADDGPGKPHPAILEQLFEETGYEPAQAAMIGDTEYDMQLAQNARTHAIGVSWGYHSPKRLRETGASDVVDSFSNLIHTLGNLFG